MFRRQLSVLDYPLPDDFDPTKRSHFANAVLWLEDQKIRHYKIEDRTALRQIGGNADGADAPIDDDGSCSPEWEEAYAQFKLDVSMPERLASPLAELSWLAGYAVRLEYMDSAESFKHISAANVAAQQLARSAAPTVHSDNPLDRLDHNAADFQSGIAALCAQLRIAEHPDALVRLQAAARFVQTRLRAEALAEPAATGMAYPVKSADGGRCAFDDDADVDQAAKILRLLQIQHLRALQTEINETIVAVQELTADPRTDSKLGKVGVK